MKLNRRQFVLGATLATLAPVGTGAARPAGPALILAPSNLGLRPHGDGRQQGAWQAPHVLMEAGLDKMLAASSVDRLDRPPYEHEAQPGTRIRNGLTIRNYSLNLASLVQKALARGAFPLVVGGDCSVLLGALYGARRSGCHGLVHLDGHSDFHHPGTPVAAQSKSLASVAGMDLALATGRGEAFLTQWPGIDGPLVDDMDTVQLGEREAFTADFAPYYGDLADTRITRLIIQDVLAMGLDAAATRILDRLEARSLDRAWLHVDLDILDEQVMPAVDSPGRPGLDFGQLSGLIHTLLASGRFAGMTVTIYDPELDPDGKYARPIIDCLKTGLEGLKRA